MNLGGLELTINRMEGINDLEGIETGIWAITNLVRGMPLPPSHLTQPAFAFFMAVIERWNIVSKKELLPDYLWTVFHLMELDPMHQLT